MQQIKISEKTLYYDCQVEQGSDSEDWLNLRKYRITGSICSNILDRGFTTSEDQVDMILGKKEKKFTEVELKRMKRGNDLEPEARNILEKKIGKKINEAGFFISKKYNHIGVSVDGIGDDFIIEVKCPVKMYDKLKNKYKNREKIIVSKDNDYSHIWPSHYDQMQWGMGISGKLFCYYMVYCPHENDYYIEKIPFNEDYFNKIMLPTATNIYEKKIRPYLPKNYPINPRIYLVV